MGATCGHKVLDGHDRDALHELWRPLGSHFLWRGFHIYERAALSQWSCCEACEVCSPSWADREEGCEGQGLPKCIPWRWLHHDVAQKKDFFLDRSSLVCPNATLTVCTVLVFCWPGQQMPQPPASAL